MPAIITNKHVVQDSIRGRFHVHCFSKSDGRHFDHLRFELDDFANRWLPHPEGDVDLCVMPIAPLILESNKQGQELFFVPLTRDLIPDATALEGLNAIEDVLMVGYPDGIWDDVHNYPVCRRGITATHPNADYRGKKEFMIDAACFHGSSGSPVFIYNSGAYMDRRENTRVGTRVILLGVLYSGPVVDASGNIVVEEVPTATRSRLQMSLLMNLGNVIKAERILELDELLQERGKVTDIR